MLLIDCAYVFFGGRVSCPGAAVVDYQWERRMYLGGFSAFTIMLLLALPLL